MKREDVSRLEREAKRRNRQLIAIIDESAAGKYIALGSVSQEYEQLSPAELAELKKRRELLVVRVEKPDGK